MINGGLETMNISFLRGHVVQITQKLRKLALQLNQEETKPKSLWQFRK